MDLVADIIYRLFTLNDAAIAESIVGGGGDNSGIEGCVLDTFDLSDVDTVQWTEKRSQADGSDAGDVFQGSRRIRFAGTLYAKSRALLFDALWDLRAALNPVLAQREEPLDKGYRPLYFSVPTNRQEDYPSGVIELKVFALPRGIQHVTQRDNLGGEELDALALPFSGSFLCKDPGIYSASPVEVEPTPASTSVTGTWDNRGNYLAKFNALIVVGSGAGNFTATVGDSVLTVTIPASSGDRTIRIKGLDKLITFEEADVEVDQMSSIAFAGDTTWPLIDPGETPYNFGTTVTGGFKTGTRFWFEEQFA